jgi:hypothetical protein
MTPEHRQKISEGGRRAWAARREAEIDMANYLLQMEREVERLRAMLQGCNCGTAQT